VTGFGDAADAGARLRDAGYLTDDAIATVVFLADRLGKPVLVEGPAGVGKTELAKAVAAAQGAELIRLQCYEGLDEAKALYEWDYRKQLLRIQADTTRSWEDTHDDIFGPAYLLTRPLLRAITAPGPTVLLIDEVDKVDVEFEALLLELLSDFQVTIPELATVTATTRRRCSPTSPAPCATATTRRSTASRWRRSPRTAGWPTPTARRGGSPTGCTATCGRAGCCAAPCPRAGWGTTPWRTGWPATPSSGACGGSASRSTPRCAAAWPRPAGSRRRPARWSARRRRSRRGGPDARRTLRRALSTGGVPVEVVHRRPVPHRPDLVLLCDVSGSVAAFARFTLLFCHELQGQFARVRSFASSIVWTK